MIFLVFTALNARWTSLVPNRISSRFKQNGSDQMRSSGHAR